MDGRQYFSGYGGTYQQAPDSSNAAYGRAYGMPGNYFVAGSGAVAPQQFGAPQPGLHATFGSQPNEDPALFVTFDDEDDDYSIPGRQINARSQPMQGRRQPPQINANAQPAAANRQQPNTGTASRPPARPSSAGATAGPTKSLSVAEQELEDLKRRIAEKEKQMKAKRQTGQGYSGMPVRSRPNPAHGPVLRGLHRKQPATEIPAEHSTEAETFLKQVAAELPSETSGQNAQPRPAASSQPAKKRTLYATLQASSGQTQTSKVPGQAPKMLFLKAVQDFQDAGGFAPCEDQDKSSDIPAQKQSMASQAQGTLQQQKQQQQPTSSKATSGPSTKPAIKAAQPEVSKPTQAAKKPQQAVAKPTRQVKASSPVAKPVSQASTSQTAVTGQPNKQAFLGPSQSLPTSPATQLQPAKPSQPVPAAAKPESHLAQSQAQASLPKADALPVKAAESKKAYNAAERTSSTHAKASQAAAAAVVQMPAASVADEWADKGVPIQSGYLQSGYHMSDSPLPEDEELILEPETSRPPSADRQQLSSADSDPAAAAAAVPFPVKTATASKHVVASLPSQQPSPKVAPQAKAKVLLTAGMDEADAAASSKGSLRLSADNTFQQQGDLPKQIPNRQSSSSAAVAAAAPMDSKGTPAASSAAAKANVTKADRVSPSGRTKPSAQAGLGLSRLSVSSSSKQTQPAEPSIPTRGAHKSGVQDPKRTPAPTPTPRSGHEPHLSSGLPGGPAQTAPPARPVKQGTPTAADKDFSSRVAEPSKPKQQKPSPKKGQPQPAAASVSAAQTKPLSAVTSQPSRDLPVPPTQPAAAPVKPSAPRQNSAALSGKARTASKAATAGLPQSDTGKQQQASQPHAQHSPVAASKPDQKQIGGVSSAAVPTSEQLPVLPSAPLSQADRASKPSRQSTPPVSLQSTPQEVPIPGLASPEGPVAVPALPSQPSHALPQQGQGTPQPPSPWVPPPPAEAPPKVPSDPYPPEPSSPRPSAIASSGKKRSRNALQQPLLPSDSGEDMEIDEEPVKETLPPLPTEPFPQGLELASINSNQELMDISVEERDSLLHELSSIHAREDELRIQKRFLNDMFAKVKQEFLEKRLRQQQIEVMLGHKSRLPALPSTAAPEAAAEQSGPSNALALRAPPESTAEPSEASPGDHKQARKAELQSRAELHKARLDALNAKQRHMSSAAAKPSSQPDVSPITQKAIVDLTAARSPAPSASRLSHLAPAMAAAADPGPAVTNPPASLGHTTPVAEAANAYSLEAKAADALQAAKPAAPTTTAAAVMNRSKKMQPPAVTSLPAAPAAAAAGIGNEAAAGSRLNKSGSSKERRPVSPGSSRQAPKRRRSRSVSPAAAAGSKGGRSQAGSQRQAVSSARRHATTRLRSRSPPIKRLCRQPAAKSRQPSLSSTTSSSSASPDRRALHVSSSSSPAKRRDRHARQSPSQSRQSRQQDRRSPLPRARTRGDPSPKGKGRRNRSPSPLDRHCRAKSPIRDRTHGRARRSPPSRPRSAHSPAGRSRQRARALAGGSTTASTSRTPSPSTRRVPSGHPPRAQADQQKAGASPQKQAKGQASASQLPASTTGRKSKENSPVKPARLSAPQAADASNSKQREFLPLPPDKLPAAYSKGSAAPAAAANGPEALLPQPGAQPTSTTAAQAESHPPERPHGRAKRVFANDKAESQGHTAVPSANLQGAVATDALQQQLQEAGKVSKTRTTLVATAAAPAADVGRPSDAAAAAPSETPAHSFDGGQSFISLEVDEAPAQGPAPVDQPSPASRKAPPAQQADKQDAKSAKPPVVQQAVSDAGPIMPAGAVQASQKQPQQGGAAAAAVIKDPADVEGDKHAIKPDLFTASRPSSAVSQGAGGPPFQASGDLKQLPAAKSKAAAKGNIQIVLATKHKQEVVKGNFPFLSLFHALSAQGLPPQAVIPDQQLQPTSLPQLPAAVDMSTCKYESPLTLFKSYRLCETFQTVSQLPLASPTFTHKLDPHWPLCVYDIRGSCRDAKCEFQHASDYQLENVAVLRDLHNQAARAGSAAPLPALPGGEISAIMMTTLTHQAIRAVPTPQIVLPSALGAPPTPQPKSRHQPRVPRERRRQLASEDPLPLYTPAPAGPPSSQSHPFASQLLSSVQVQREAVSWLLLPGWEGYDNLMHFGTLLQLGSIPDYAVRSAEPHTAQTKADKLTGRYYQASGQDATQAAAAAAAATAASAADAKAAVEAERTARLAEREGIVAADPGNEQLWLLFALQHIDFGAVESMQGQKLMSCLKCISKGLEADSSFTRLWLLYLPLYRRHTSTKGDPSDATHVAESCLSHSKHCYQLWLTAIQLQPVWQQRATLLQRGIVALSQTKAGQYHGLSKEEEEGWAGMRSACVLDLTLRLLLLWTSAEANDVVASWIQELTKAAGQAVLAAQTEEDPLTMEERALAPAARQALLQQTARYPVSTAVLWLTCAHLAAYNTLPSQVIHRLGSVQQPFVLDWQQVPPVSSHSRIRSILTTAAALRPLSLKAKLQVAKESDIQKVVAAAWPRQALALTIADWELATKTPPILGSLPLTLAQTAINPAAGSLLMLSNLVSKASCTVHHPLPDQAMDAWQHATWPTGDTDLLCMGLVLAADQQLQAFVDILASDQETNQGQQVGKLQHAVAAAASLLSQLAVCAAEAQAAVAAAGDSAGREQSPHLPQSQGLHPAVVGATAVRVYQISDGNPAAAMAILVASVLPEWELDLPRAQQAETRSLPEGPAILANGHPEGIEEEMSPSALATQRARQGSYRKRVRSPSRSSSPGKGTPHSSKAHSKKRRTSISSRSSNASTSSSSSSYSSSQSGSSSRSSSRSSGSSSGSGTTSSHPSHFSHDVSIKSDPGRLQYASALSEGLQTDQSTDMAMDVEHSLEADWAAVEAAGSLGALALVRQGFQELSAPEEPSQDAQDFEEGEIRAADQDMKRSHAALWSLNLGLYEALDGQAPQALSALQAAMKTAEGNAHLQQHMWKEVLEFASVALSSQTAAKAVATGAGSAQQRAAATAQGHAAASVEGLAEAQRPVGFRQKLRLMQQFLAWQQEHAVLQPLALPKLPVQDTRARGLLTQPCFQDGEGMRDGISALLAHATAAEEVATLESLVSRTLATAAKAQLLLDLAARKPQDGQYASWILPLAASALLNAAPPAAPHLWLQAIVLAEKHSVAAAKELSVLSVARHPHSKALAKRLTALKSSPTGTAATKQNTAP